MRLPAGDSGTPSLVPPGDPSGLRQAAVAARTVADRMGEAAATTRSAVLPAPEWVGPAAGVAATRIEAAAVAQQIASDAFYSAAGALDGYAEALEAAQATGRRAEAAAEDCRAFQTRLAALPPPGSLAAMAGSAMINPFSEQERRAALVAAVDEAADQATTLAAQAAAAAAEAASRAAASFARIAALAGNPAYHHSADPFAAETGTGDATDAAEVALSALGMAGVALVDSRTTGADTHMLADLSRDANLGPDGESLLAARLDADRSASALAATFTEVLSKRGITIPKGVDELDPVLQAGLLGWMVTHVEPAHQPWWEQAVSVGLRAGSAALGTAGIVTGAVSLFLPPGADVIGEGLGGVEDGAAAAAGAGAEAISGAGASEEALSAAEKAARLGRALDVAGAGLAAGATGFDFVNLLDGTTDFDPVTFALDGAALVPTLGAVGADLRIANLDEELVSARMAGDPATFSAVRAQIMATGTVRIVLGSKAFAIGAGAAAYSAGAFTAQQIAGAGGG